jgi:penicillin G amidase
VRPTRLIRNIALALGALILLAVAAIYFALRASLPQLEGDIRSPTLRSAASIERDADGTPAIRAASRRDLAFATGFAHGQDRFFQMDLMRRAAAGELAELLGAQAVDADKKFRLHGFRHVATQVIESSDARDREILRSYAAGVNSALSHARARPWEYLLLRAQPVQWRIEDSLLVAFSMYLNLNDSSGEDELARVKLRETLPAELFAFLHPLGTEWDAPIVGGRWRAPSAPGPETFDLRSGAARVAATLTPRSAALEEKVFPGSNSWAVAGTHAKNHAALLANDMHLGLRLPHVWYRARLMVDSQDESRRDLIGVTLPGVPMLIVGSNRKVAWGYTNSYGDWTDLVIVETDSRDPGRYLTPEGSAPFELRREQIKVRGADTVTLEVKWTRWGPIVNHDTAGRPLALAWTAHYPQATNIRMMDLELAANVDEALAAANRSGGPVQNFVAADADGRIGWSLMGQVPVRANYDSTLPASWRTAGTGWTGWRTPQEYPRIVDPASGRLWTANARTIDAQAWLAFLGDGGYDLGARAAQIRDGLLALSAAREEDLVAIQLDDRALFLARWRDLAMDLLSDAVIAGHPLRAEAKALVLNWSAHAAAEDAGYRIVRALRTQIRKDVFESLIAVARRRYPQTNFVPSSQFEAPLWQLVTQRPAHLLDPRYPTWQAALIASIDTAIETLRQQCGTLKECTWGAENTLRMRHPLSSALPLAAHWLDMPAEPMPGDSAMPRVQGVAFGASERMVVSPGREADGYFQMPGGPVDHPLSPFYGAGHDAWVHGKPTRLLPGAAKYVLRLRPQQ